MKKKLFADSFTSNPSKVLPPFILPFKFGNAESLGDLAEFITSRIPFGTELVNLLMGVRREVHFISRTGRAVS
jgi:hypothetical protein